MRNEVRVRFRKSKTEENEMVLKEEPMRAEELVKYPQYVVGNLAVDASVLRSILMRRMGAELETLGVVRVTYDPAGSVSLYFATGKGLNEKILRIEEMVKPYVQK
jgi:hypothetical protein